MFFKKWRDAKKAAAEEARQQILGEFKSQFEEAKACADPGEKILKLQEIQDAVDDMVAVTTTGIRGKAKSEWYKHYIGVGGGGMAAIGVLVLALGFPPALIMLAYPAIFGGAVSGSFAVQRAHKRFMEENRPFFEALEGQKQQAAAFAAEVLQNEARALAVSAKLPEILEKAPNLRKQIAEAFAKKVAAGDKNPPPPPPKPPGGSGFHL
jgi:hypothetical protein